MLKLTRVNAAAYARRAGLYPADAHDILVRGLAGGVSCAGFIVEKKGHPSYAIKQARARLRVRARWESHPARAQHEFLGLKLASEIWTAGAAPEPVLYDKENAIVVMSAIPEPHKVWKSELLAGRVDLGIAAQCGVRLAELHGAPSHHKLSKQLANKTYFRELRIEAYFDETARRDPDAAPYLRGLCEDLLRNDDALVHGDFTPKNMLVRNGELIILDFEVLHLGHYVFDVASLLNHLMLKSLHVAKQRESLRRAADTFLENYCRVSGTSSAAPLLWRCLGGLMMARVLGKSPVEYLTTPEKRLAVCCGMRLLRGETLALSNIVFD